MNQFKHSSVWFVIIDIIKIDILKYKFKDKNAPAILKKITAYYMERNFHHDRRNNNYLYIVILLDIFFFYRFNIYIYVIFFIFNMTVRVNMRSLFYLIYSIGHDWIRSSIIITYIRNIILTNFLYALRYIHTRTLYVY